MGNLKRFFRNAESPKNPMGSSAKALEAIKIVTKFELCSTRFLDSAIADSCDMKYSMMEKQQELTTAVTI